MLLTPFDFFIQQNKYLKLQIEIITKRGLCVVINPNNKAEALFMKHKSLFISLFISIFIITL